MTNANDKIPGVVTRFAPSPTGYLHIGGARTALFNWLFARHHGGKYLLRIEDTDKVRSTKEAIDAILDGLDWLGISGDGEPYFQSQFEKRHAEVAHQLLEKGAAYRCYMTQDELATARSASTPIATSLASFPRPCSTIYSVSAGDTATTKSSAASRRSSGSTSTMWARARRALT